MVLKIFLTNFKKKGEEKYEMYRKLIDCLNFFDRQIEYSQNNFNVFISNLNQYKTNFEESSNMILRKQDEFISAVKRDNIDLNQDDFLKSFAGLIRQWHQNKDWKNLDVFENLLLEPLRELCKSNIVDSRSITLLEYIIKSSRSLEKIKDIKKVYSEYFSDEAKHLGEKKELFLIAVKDFR